MLDLVLRRGKDNFRDVESILELFWIFYSFKVEMIMLQELI